MDDKNFSSDTTQEVSDEAKRVAKNIAKKPIDKAKKQAKKLIGKAVKIGAKAVGKALLSLINGLIALLGPWIFVLLVVVIVVYFAWDTTYESRGKEQNYQDVTVQEDNPLAKDENGELVAEGLSQGNKIVKAFYTYFSEESYYYTIGDNKTLYNPINNPSAKKPKDKYNREKYFYLNPNMLWSLDEFLNEDKFRFPEQFVKPVYHDIDTFTLKDLTDGNGYLTAESTKYEKNGDEYKPVSGEKVKGVWDYGFAPILHYEEYEEKKDGKGNLAYDEEWDYDNQQIVEKSLSDKDKEESVTETFPGYPKDVYMIDKVISASGTISNKIKNEYQDTGVPWEKIVEYEKKVKKFEMGDVHQKDSLGRLLYYDTTTTSEDKWGVVGTENIYLKDANGNQLYYDYTTLCNENWISGYNGEWYGYKGNTCSITDYFSQDEVTRKEYVIVGSQPFSTSVPKYDYVTLKTIVNNGNTYTTVNTGYPVYKTVDKYGWIERARSTESGEERDTETKSVLAGYKYSGYSVVPIYVNKSFSKTYKYTEGTTTRDTGKPYTKLEKVREWEEEITLKKVYRGTIWEQIPKYEGDPDTSQVTGTKYFREYFENYSTYVPPKVMDGFDFKEIRERTGKTDKELLELFEGDFGGSATAYEVDMSNFQMGVGASSEPAKKALQYLSIFEKYGEMYGVDPYILVAKASQESGGNHEAYATADRCSIAGCGIMQIEKPGIVKTSISAYNQQTKQIDTMTINSYQDVASVDANIKAGTMEFASRLKDNGYNVLLSLQAYNYGSGGIGAVIKLYSQATGKSIEQIKSSPQDLGWLAYREEVHKNPSKYFSWNEGTYGDPLYVEHVLRYYLKTPKNPNPYVVKEDGSKVELVDLGNIPTGFSTGISVIDNIFGWISSSWTKIKNGWNALFPEVTPILPKERLLYTNNIRESESQGIINMMYVMEERKYFSEYEDKDDDYWKERIAEMFRNPIGTNWNNSASGVNPSEYFSNGYMSPLKLNPSTISKNYGNITSGEKTMFHEGVDIIAPIGTDVFAVADGTIQKVDKKSKERGTYIEINHGRGVSTIYGNLSSVNIKEGDNVTKGTLIGKTGDSGSEKSASLHFELKQNGSPKNPAWIITGEGAYIGEVPPLSPEASAQAKKVIEEAYKHLGKPYVWGATGQIITDTELQRLKNQFGANEYPQVPSTIIGKQGFDCSGFTLYTYKKALGIDIPRTTWALWEGLPRVRQQDAEPGDLILCANLGHVMLYLGEGKAIHAPASNDVIKITTVNWSSIDGVVRVIK